MSEDKEKIHLQCCFCGSTIHPGGSSPVSIAIDLKDGATQGLYSHAECLRKALHPSVPLGVEIENEK
jgi:hypothetical protein